MAFFQNVEFLSKTFIQVTSRKACKIWSLHSSVADHITPYQPLCSYQCFNRLQCQGQAVQWKYHNTSRCRCLFTNHHSIACQKTWLLYRNVSFWW